MKTSIGWQTLSRLAVVALLFLFCCSDPDVDEITPPPSEEEEELAPEDADALLEAFSFSSGKKNYRERTRGNKYSACKKR